MREVKINLYQFDELGEKAQEKVLEKFRYINVEDDWYQPIYDQFREEVQEGYGISVDEMNFSGFYSQGDGASFEGGIYDFKKFAEKTGLKKLARFSKAIEYNLEMKITRVTYQYYHSNTVEADNYGEAYEKAISMLSEIARDVPIKNIVQHISGAEMYDDDGNFKGGISNCMDELK